MAAGTDRHERHERRRGTDRHEGEARAQEPVVRAGSGDAATEQIIVESPCPEFASGKGERPRSRRGPADRAHHLNAVDGFRTHTADIGHVHDCAAAGRAAADHQLVGGRVVASEHGVDGHRAASSRVAGRCQDRTRRSARAHVHQAGIGEAGYALTEAIEIERSAPRDRDR
jgi:hypothetical protein